MEGIELLLAREAIKETKARYCLAIDGKDVSGMAALFAPDARLDASEALSVRDPATGAFDRPLYDGKAEGAETIAAFVIKSVEGFRTCHHVHSPIIDFAGDDRATVIWAMEDNLYCAAGDPFRSLHGLGHYRETYVKRGGKWLIESLKLTRLNVEIMA